MKKRLVILISGRGSNMEAILRAAADPAYPGQVVAVIANRPDAKGLETAKAAGIATAKAGEASKGSAAASDAFFPFADGLDSLTSAGVTAVVQPGGSVRDAEVIAAADAAGIVMMVTGERHFRH